MAKKKSKRAVVKRKKANGPSGGGSGPRLPKKLRDLTPAEYKRLGEQIIDTRLNVFRVVEASFGPGVATGDQTFDGLRKHAGMFKCELCDRWLDAEEEEWEREGGVCERCMSDGEDDE